ncbi:MAG: phosphatidate cytidylyltransferase [Desulfuromonadaceae bacterium]|nr:phosphatidate cytidylyltransferase [Desulfuromonadaceae bacterium]
MLPIVILIVLKGGPILLACLLALLSVIAMTEFYAMALPERKMEQWQAALAGTALIFIPFAGDEKVIVPAIGLLFVSFTLLFLFRIRAIETAAREIAFALLAFLYIPFLLMHLVLLRQTPFGIQWLFVIMLIVMSNDSAAYYIGSTFGKRRLYPLVSPKKSIEGAIGGLFGSLGGTMLAKFTFFPQLTIRDAVATALVIGMVGQAGDLFESLLKRSFGVKDSGTLIPGHGGVLDRMDSILFAAPVTYYYVLFFFRG